MINVYNEIKKRIQCGQSFDRIKKDLANEGYANEDVIEAVIKYNLEGSQIGRKNQHKLFVKEALDKAGYGLTSLQIINILFSINGVSSFIIGLINGFKAILNIFISSFLKKYSLKNVHGAIAAFAGIFYGLTFLAAAGAIYYNLNSFFITAFLLGGIAVILYGEYHHDALLNLKRGSSLMNKLTKYGLVITALGLFSCAYAMDNFRGGYILIFSTAGAFFIISGGLALSILEKKTASSERTIFAVFKSVFSVNNLKEPLIILKNKALLIMLIAGSIISLAQTIGNSYYGIFIYRTFHDTGFGGFLNVAMVFLIAVFSSLIGSIVTRMDVKAYGRFPVLVFGTLLLALMPFSYFYKPTLVTVTMGTMFGVIGGAIVGFAHGLLTIELNDKEKRHYFSLSNLLIFAIYLIFVPLLAMFANNYGFELLFLLLAVIFIMVAPLYLIIILQEKKG